MKVTQYVALLRGINVGGRNKVPMVKLRAALEDAGYAAVRTYIQSGNVLFETAEPAKSLEANIEGALERNLGFPLVVVVRSHAQLRKVVTGAPSGFGKAPDRYHSDVLFLKAPLTSKRAMAALDLADGVDESWPGNGVVYFARLSAERTRSKLGRVAAKPEYQLLTIRSWATTTKLLELLDQHATES